MSLTLALALAAVVTARRESSAVANARPLSRSTGVKAPAVAAPAVPAPIAITATAAGEVVAQIHSPAQRAVTAPATRPGRAESPSVTARSLASGMVVRRDENSDASTAPADPALVRTMDVEGLQELAHREAEGLVTVRNSDGSETLNHEGRFRDFSVVRAGSGGKPLFRCVHGSAGVRHVLHKDLPVRPVTEEE
ncbi:MAG: hypothetical protein ABIR22_08280 [Candidatus Eisenbacteria bacterium]